MHGRPAQPVEGPHSPRESLGHRQAAAGISTARAGRRKLALRTVRIPRVDHIRRAQSRRFTTRAADAPSAVYRLLGSATTLLHTGRLALRPERSVQTMIRFVGMPGPKLGVARIRARPDTASARQTGHPG